jgi:hypothetical protein
VEKTVFEGVLAGRLLLFRDALDFTAFPVDVIVQKLPLRHCILKIYAGILKNNDLSLRLCGIDRDRMLLSKLELIEVLGTLISLHFILRQLLTDFLEASNGSKGALFLV